MATKSIRLTDGTDTLLPESATSASGYQKNADGTLIQWGKITIRNVPITNAWGNLYESASIASGVTFQIPFLETPTLVAFASCTPTAWLETLGVDSTKLGSFYLLRTTSSTGTNGYVHWLAIGRWK